MGANTSVESMEKAIEAINEEARKAFSLNQKIIEFMNSIDWSDDKGTDFKSALSAMSQKLLEPMPSLKNARDKIEHLKDVVEKYNNNIQF